MSQLFVDWWEIERKLDSMRPVKGGFSRAKKGMVTLEDGSDVFVKVGLDDNTRRWTKKEINTYKFLHRHDYLHAPSLLAVNNDDSGFVLGGYTPGRGWDWDENWNIERLENTLGAMESLAGIELSTEEANFFSEKSFDEKNSGWLILNESPQSQQRLRDRLHAVGRHDIAESIDFADSAVESHKFVFSNDSLVHYDVRADNCAWNAVSKEICLVDWNWVQLGDKRIDRASLAACVYKSGFDVSSCDIGEINTGALHWLAGFWLNASLSPAREIGFDKLRHSQLLSGIAALDLIDRIT
jgi:Ser/Thr protein kinase RdoA (MazF antagonist)